MSRPIHVAYINDEVNIVDLWRKLDAGELKKSGASLLARCLRPQNHANGDKNPSLVLGGKKNIAWCPVCDFHWTPLTLVSEIAFKTRGEDMPNDVFYKSCAFLAETFLNGKLPLKDGSWENVGKGWRVAGGEKNKELVVGGGWRAEQAQDMKTRFPQPAINNQQPTPNFDALSPQDTTFLQTYGLSEEIIHASKLRRYAHPSLGPGIVYPSPPENPMALKFKSLARDEKGKRSCVFLQGDKKILYGAHTMKPDSPLILKGGEEKRLLLHQLNYAAVSSFFGEGNLDESQAEEIARNRPSRVVIAFDADPAGREGQNRAGRKLLDAGLPQERLFAAHWRESLPSGYDVNDLFRDQGEKAVHELIDSAPRLTPTLFCALNAREDCWKMDAVQEMDIDWLWEPWIPQGMLTILTGDPNAGKTWLALQFCAIVSKGYPFPDPETGMPASDQLSMISHQSSVIDGTQTVKNNQQPTTRDPRSAIYVTYEDHLRVTIKKRLNSMDCDQSRVFVPKNLDGGLRLDKPDRIEALLKEHHPRILIFDPLTAALGERINMNAAEEVTRLLTPIVKLAESYSCAILLVRHQSKAERDKVLDRGMGSIAFSGMARSEILLGRDPDDPRERILFLIKCPEKEAKPIAYRCDGRFEWCGVSELTPGDLGKSTSEKKKSASREASEEWLLSRLSNGPVLGNAIIEEASKLDEPISERTLRRVKNNLNVKSIRITEGNNGKGGWYWALPEQNL